MTRLAFTIVIPTLDRPEELGRTLAGVAMQTRPPTETIIVDSSAGGDSKTVAERWAGRLPVRYEHTVHRSAAQQRNVGGMLVEPASTPLIAFIDDDITLRPDTSARICDAFENDAASAVGGVAARIEEIHRPQPSGWSWWYYRLQAGYADPTYGGKLFGPAINCLPCYRDDEPELISAQWLNTGCVFYRTELFQKELFPTFEGHSFMEDVHLSARIARTHRLYFHRNASCSHRDGAVVGTERALARHARMRMRNQRAVAAGVLGKHGPAFELQLLFHRVFVSIGILRRRGQNRRQELLGTWT